MPLLRRFSLLVLAMMAGQIVAPSAIAETRLLATSTQSELVEAIVWANNRQGPDRVVLLPNERYVLHSDPDQIDALPAIEGRLIIVGNGAVLDLVSPGPSTHLTIAPAADLLLHHVTLRGATRGAVTNFGHLALEYSVIEDNSTDIGASALDNTGSARIAASSIRFNSYSGSDQNGGTIVNGGQLEFIDSVIEANTAFGPSVDAVALVNLGEVIIVRSYMADHRGTWPAALVVNRPGAAMKIHEVSLDDNGMIPLVMADLPGR